jgi:ditrans,polycis-polyprenyl diphosphate synthase
MMTNLAGSPPLDILVRSSGVKRLSDFLMWQARFSPETARTAIVAHGAVSLHSQASENVQLHFSPTYWPDFGFWDLFPVILGYQVKVWSQQGAAGELSAG